MNRNRSTEVAILLIFLIATIAMDAAPTTAPATQPFVQYNKFDDRTFVSIELPGMMIMYAFPGKLQPPIVDDLGLFVSPDLRPRNNRLIFLVDENSRVQLDLPQNDLCLIKTDWLAQFVSAKSVEINIGPTAEGITDCNFRPFCQSVAALQTALPNAWSTSIGRAIPCPQDRF